MNSRHNSTLMFRSVIREGLKHPTDEAFRIWGARRFHSGILCGKNALWSARVLAFLLECSCSGSALLIVLWHTHSWPGSYFQNPQSRGKWRSGVVCISRLCHLRSSIICVTLFVLVVAFKDVRTNCFCAFLLCTQILCRNYGATSFIERAHGGRFVWVIACFLVKLRINITCVFRNCRNCPSRAATRAISAISENTSDINP